MPYKMITMRMYAHPLWALVLVVALLAPHAGGMVLCMCADGNRVLESAYSDACPCDEVLVETTRDRGQSGGCDTCTKAPITAVVGAASTLASHQRATDADTSAILPLLTCHVESEREWIPAASAHRSNAAAPILTTTVVIQI